MIPDFSDTRVAFEYRTNAALRKARFLFSSMGSPLLTKVGMGLTNWALRWKLPIKGIIKSTIYEQFVGGETMEEAARTATALAKYGIGVILDYGVEGAKGEASFDAAVPEFIRAIEYAASQQGNIPFISIKVTGFADFALLEKLHRGDALTTDEDAAWLRIQDRIFRICAAGAKHKIMVLIDAEESWIQHPVDQLADLAMERFNKDRHAWVFNTFQHYRHDRLEFLQASMQRARQAGYMLGAKLVRGAYMEKERRRAEEQGYPSPIQPDKTSADRDYDAAARHCLENLEHCALFVGTHNEGSCQKAAQWMNDHGVPPNHPRVWFSQLYGMSDNISFNLAHAGYRVAKYLPYGPVEDVMPYLMRRAQENTSVAGQTGRELQLINRELKRRQGR